MQKTKSILVLCCMVILLLPAAMPFILQLRIFLAREEAMERLEDQHLQVIRVRNSQVRWAEEGRELLVDGHLFDVRSVRQGPGEIEATGIFDDQETVLAQKIGDFWNDQQTKNRMLVIRFFQDLGNSCISKNDWSCQQPLIRSKTLSQYFIQQINDIYIRIPDPPPQAIS